MDHPAIGQSLTWIYTADLEATAAFYADRIGLELAFDQGTCRIFRLCPSGFLGVCQVRPGRFVEPKGVVITIVTPDVDGWHRHLLSRGVVPEGPPERKPAFNIYGFFARDPNGYLLEFQTFLDPAWPAVSPSVGPGTFQ